MKLWMPAIVSPGRLISDARNLGNCALDIEIKTGVALCSSTELITEKENSNASSATISLPSHRSTTSSPVVPFQETYETCQPAVSHVDVSPTNDDPSSPVMVISGLKLDRTVNLVDIPTVIMLSLPDKGVDWLMFLPRNLTSAISKGADPCATPSNAWSGLSTVIRGMFTGGR